MYKDRQQIYTYRNLRGWRCGAVLRIIIVQVGLP